MTSRAGEASVSSEMRGIDSTDAFSGTEEHSAQLHRPVKDANL